jgi:spoIIIJ-associated protein
VAHAEASARTVDAAVTAAAAQLGLRPDQVDIEILEDPVPSTFGYIGSPARVRVTSRRPTSPSGDASDAARGSPPAPRGAASPTQPSDAVGVAVEGQPSDTAQDAGSARPTGLAQVVPPHEAGVGQAPGPGQTPDQSRASDRAQAAGSPVARPVGLVAGPGNPGDTNPTNDSYDPNRSEASIDSASSSGQVPRRPATDTARGSTSADSTSAEVRDRSGSAASQTPPPPAPSSPVAAGLDASGTVGAGTETTETTTVTAVPAAQPSSSIATGAGHHGSAPTGAAVVTTAAAASAMEKLPPASSVPEPSDVPRPRRTPRDEPIEPEMVEADTERAGDFLEGLLDALDVDGDITTWIDEVGGHVDLEGPDLNVLVGSNGETLDALQELTRIAVLRQSKRRVRLLLDINGFRSRQRDQLISVVKATAERVISSREEQELQPMTPAERKIVHDAAAAIDGVQTESTGEDPYRRVVIRPT